MNSKIREIVYTCDGDFPEKIKDIIVLLEGILKGTPEQYVDSLQLAFDYDGGVFAYYNREDKS